MRACLVAHRFYDDNAHMMQFAKALVKRGDEVDVISLRRKGLARCEVVDGVRVCRVQSRTVGETSKLAHLVKTMIFVMRAAARIFLSHCRRPYDLIHVQSVPDFLVFAALLPRLLGAKVILDLRDLVPELYASKFGVPADSLVFRLLLAVEKISARIADHVLVSNPIWHERIAERSASRLKCTMFWYYPDPDFFYPRERHRNDGKTVITYPGTLNVHQGLDIAVKAFPKILKALPGAELHIYGEGPAKSRISALVEELGLSANVRLLQPMPLKEIVGVMADSDLALVPKRAGGGFGDEAASTKIPEFLALGIPVVATRTRVEASFFDSSVVQYFESENEDDLARAVLAVCRTPGLRRRLIANGLAYTKRTSWDAEMSRYRTLVDSLVQHGNPANAGSSSPRWARFIKDWYYIMKPLIPRPVQFGLRREVATRQRAHNRGRWPICELDGTVPPAFPGWPGGKPFAVVLTHDVESARGLSNCERLADLEETRGLRSTFGFVPLRYRTPEKLRNLLLDRGFEIVVHDLYHDGKLYRHRELFERRSAQIRQFLREWHTSGFCSGSMHHDLRWISELEIDYDVSTYDVDPFEPQACGFGRIFPFWVQSPDRAARGFVEIPYTLPQDFTLFVLLREESNSTWKRKLDWIAAKGGMALIKTHPDYMVFPGEPKRIDGYPVELYADFLDYLRQRYASEAWFAQPSEIARFWRGLHPPGMRTGTAIPFVESLCHRCRDAHAAGWLTSYSANEPAARSGRGARGVPVHNFCSADI